MRRGDPERHVVGGWAAGGEESGGGPADGEPQRRIGVLEGIGHGCATSSTVMDSARTAAS
jgi:hypothetical protein